MTTARNDHTGDLIISKTTTEQYRENYDRIFGNRPKMVVVDDVESDEPVAEVAESDDTARPAEER
jgi:hypothetical protein